MSYLTCNCRDFILYPSSFILSLAPALPHAAVGGFDVAGESRGVYQGRFQHTLAQGGPQSGQARQVASQLGREAHIVVDVGGHQFRQSHVLRMLSPPRPTAVSPPRLTTGTPIHRASQVVVPPP